MLYIFYVFGVDKYIHGTTIVYVTTKTKQLLPLAGNIKPEALLKELHSAEGRLAEYISNFAGSMPFVYFHVIWFMLWIVINEGLAKPYLHPFDPFPYGLLTMVVSLEAIFLATFIMINQNRQALIETYRELEEEREEQQSEEEVENIQQDLDDIKNAISFIQQKITHVEKAQTTTSGNGNGNGNGSAPAKAA